MDASTPIDGGGRAGAAYRVLARKYRPQTFDDLVGQDPMVRTLTNAFASGRIAQAYMLTGVRGVGKTTTARILARALNYAIPGKVDRPTVAMAELGEHCASIMEGRHVDVIEMDAASHTGIGDIREITEASRYRPAIARYKVYIIDEVHMLSTQAFNGLLKTLEEPPEHVKFIFATTEIRKVPVTVLSRCQRFDLRRIEADKLAALLKTIAAKESVDVDDDAVAMIARAAEGSARDALSLLDQASSHGSGRVAADEVRAMLGLADRAQIIDLFEALMRGDAAAALTGLAAQYEWGADPLVVLMDLASFTHVVTRIKVAPAAADDPSLSPQERDRGRALAETLSLRALSRTWQILLKGVTEVQESPRPLAAADMVLVRLAYAADLPTLDETLRLWRESGSAGEAPSPIAAGGSPQPGLPAMGPRPATVGGGREAPRPAAIDSRPPGPSRPSSSVSPAGPSPAAASPAGALAAAPGRPSAMQAAAEPAPANDAPRLSSLAELVALAGARRDIPIKVGLERNVRLIRFEPGRIELALTEETPPTFLGDLGRRLTEWTGERWVVMLGRGEAQPTIHEQQQSTRARLMTDARADPLVATVLSRFPGAEIVDVRISGPAELDIADETGLPAELEPPEDD